MVGVRCMHGGLCAVCPLCVRLMHGDSALRAWDRCAGRRQKTKADEERTLRRRSRRTQANSLFVGSGSWISFLRQAACGGKPPAPPWRSDPIFLFSQECSIGDGTRRPPAFKPIFQPKGLRRVINLYIVPLGEPMEVILAWPRVSARFARTNPIIEALRSFPPGSATRLPE
jgi:hypothetical protein